MFKKGLLLIAICAAFIFGSALTASAQSWELLGSKNVGDRVDHDRIMVTSVRGDFRRLKFTVLRRPIEFYRVVVHFANGANQSIELRQQIRAGGESRWVNLRGGDRVIRRVDFWYDAKSLRGKSARIMMYGRG